MTSVPDSSTLKIEQEDQMGSVAVNLWVNKR